MEQEYKIAGKEHAAQVRRKGSGAVIQLGEKEFQAALHPLGDGEYRLELDGNSERVWVVTRGDRAYVHAAGANWEVTRIDPLEKLAGAAGAGAADRAEAPMPGTVVRVEVKPGEKVRRGQTLMVIESMKLETSINAWRDGVVAEIHQQAGATFERRAPLIALEPEASGRGAADRSLSEE